MEWGDNLNEQRFIRPEEIRGYKVGFKEGYKEGLQKASMLIQLIACSTDQFTENIIQNSPEAIELRKLMAGSE